jgi:hypothetical protein
MGVNSNAKVNFQWQEFPHENTLNKLFGQPRGVPKMTSLGHWPNRLDEGLPVDEITIEIASPQK